jgi:hypothetical protein
MGVEDATTGHVENGSRKEGFVVLYAGEREKG